MTRSAAQPPLYALRIKKLRSDHGMKQEELAARLRPITGLSLERSHISKWENGVHKPDLDCLLALSKVFGVSIEYLLGDSDAETYTERARWDGTLQSLKDDERILLKAYGELGEDEKRFLRRQIEALRRERERGDS